MARKLRHAPGGIAYHVMNRTWGPIELFQDADDYAAFERVLAEARRREGMRLCAYALMPNHFHLVLYPRLDGQLSRFMQWLTMTHTQRWHAHRQDVGRGHLYQSRYRSFPIQADDHFLAACRYVERNALRAGLARRAEDWPWASLAMRVNKLAKGQLSLDEWPVAAPRDWVATVNRAENAKELEALRRSAWRGQPYGAEPWVRRTAARLGLESTLRAVGRPEKGEKEGRK